MSASEKYTAAAYLVVFVGVLALRADHRLEAAAAASAQVADIVEELRERGPRPMAELLFWPALLGYGEAAIAYTSPRHTRFATWGVRIGWLAQTALLVVQARRVDGFPWSTWAGSLNLFVWFTVGAYLIWGCQAALPARRAHGDAARRRPLHRLAHRGRDGCRQSARTTRTSS